MKTILTGVQATGQPHLGNYIGAMRPALALVQTQNVEKTESFFFIADSHALTAVHDAKLLSQWIAEVAASWLACGLDPKTTVIYRQSHIPEIFELHWLLSCISPKGFMNRAHAYKAKVQENLQAGRADEDDGVNMGLFTYPLLMSADILAFDTDFVPVGEDQLQHLEITRDLAQKFNRQFGETLKVPQVLAQKSRTILGLDGRKMSKSYGNHIPLFVDDKKLRAFVMKIKTDSSPPDAPKSTEGSLLFDLYKDWAQPEDIEALAADYARGVGWGFVKEALFEVINRAVTDKRKLYNEYISDRGHLDVILQDGAIRARQRAHDVLTRVRRAVGLSS